MSNLEISTAPASQGAAVSEAYAVYVKLPRFDIGFQLDGSIVLLATGAPPAVPCDLRASLRQHPLTTAQALELAAWIVTLAGREEFDRVFSAIEKTPHHSQLVAFLAARDNLETP